MRKIKKNKFWVNFISWFVAFIIGNAVSDYFGLKGKTLSLNFVLRFGILLLTFTIIEFLVSKIMYVWDKNYNK